MVAEIPGEGNGNPFQYSYLENPHGQRSLVGYSPWGRKESDMTERLTLSLFLGESYSEKGSRMRMEPWGIPVGIGKNQESKA